MKKSLCTILVIVLFPVIAMADDCPTPATATATVTFKRHSSSPTLDGVFTVDAGGTTVKFSKGNLQYQASTDTWQFAAHQYDYIGGDNSNISSSYDGWIDLFGWATAGNSESGTHYQPWDSSTDDTYGNTVAQWASVNLTSAHDWGSNIGTGWRTMTNQEWDYIVNTRASGAAVEGVSDARYIHVAITINEITITGLLLFPDGYNQGTPSGVTWSADHINKHEAFYAATCTAAGWETLEDAGCVFLPYAGQRDGTTVSMVGTEGFYWSATSGSQTDGSALHIPASNALANSSRHLGNSVRLVHQEP